jgi:D-psicose/D-tagatose/L-ribulose 3-epimerase
MGRFTYGLELLLWTEFVRKENMPLLKKTKKLGFDGVELFIDNPEAFPVEETKKALKENDLKVSFAVCQGKDTNTISPDANVRKAGVNFLKKCIDVAHAVGGPGSGIGGVNYAGWGYFTGTARTKQEWGWGTSCYREIARHAKEKGINLNIEPVNRFETYFINCAADAVQFCKDVGEPNVKVHLDTYHMMREEKDLYKAITGTGKYLGYFHACENERGVPGTGLVPWETVYKALKDMDYKGWITIESFTPDIKSLARLTAIWRKHAPSADALAGDGLKNIRAVEKKVFGS